MMMMNHNKLKVPVKYSLKEFSWLNLTFNDGRMKIKKIDNFVSFSCLKESVKKKVNLMCHTELSYNRYYYKHDKIFIDREEKK